jgi:hypothetical protein
VNPAIYASSTADSNHLRGLRTPPQTNHVQKAAGANQEEPAEPLDEYFEQANQTKTFACGCVPGDRSEQEFEEICDLDYGRLLFCVEEAPLVCKAGYMQPVFGRIVRTGRHRHLDLLWTAQRASEVSCTLTRAHGLLDFLFPE